jgi:hypothetical protein
MISVTLLIYKSLLQCRATHHRDHRNSGDFFRIFRRNSAYQAENQENFCKLEERARSRALIISFVVELPEEFLFEAVSVAGAFLARLVKNSNFESIR